MEAVQNLYSWQQNSAWRHHKHSFLFKVEVYKFMFTIAVMPTVVTSEVMCVCGGGGGKRREHKCIGIEVKNMYRNTFVNCTVLIINS
jgi:hypothetical protein